MPPIKKAANTGEKVGVAAVMAKNAQWRMPKTRRFEHRPNEEE